MPIELPKGVKVSMADGIVTVEGPKGKLTQDIRPEVELKIEDTVATVVPTVEGKAGGAYQGLYRTLINNMIIGTTQGYSKALVINGVGYRAEIKGKSLMLSLGFSNIIEYEMPEGVDVATEGTTKVIISGADKAAVGQVVAEIRGLRPPEPYKGKGVRYENETIRRKVGKSGA
jgi:large subunit ribosomal protein L6